MNKTSYCMGCEIVCVCARGRACTCMLAGWKEILKKRDREHKGRHACANPDDIFFFEGTRCVKMLLIKVWKKVTQNK